MRLIDADALLEVLKDSHFPGAPYVDAGISIAIGKVCVAPTIEPERKTGHWKFDWKHDKATCSECGHIFRCVFDIDNFDNFCRHCGAKMEDSR